MKRSFKEILKKIAALILSIQLVFVLSGFVFNINPPNCCHSKKEVKKTHSCCEKKNDKTPRKCESSQPISGYNLGNCGCIHSNSDRNSDFTVQNSFELQKENIVALVYFNIDQPINNFDAHLKHRIEREHSPPIFMIDSAFRI